jgi:hypothetical protein
VFRKLLSLVLVVGVAAVCSGCAENEHKITQKQESQTESEPTDSSPGTPVLE